MFNNDPEKVKRVSKTLRIILEVFQKVVFCFGAVLFLALIYLLVNPAGFIKLPQSGSLIIPLTLNGIISYRVSPGIEFSTVKPVFLALIPVVILGVAMLTVVLSQIRGILKTVESGNPFDELNSRRLSKIAMVVIIGSNVWNFVQSLVVKTVVETFNIPNIVENFSFDSTMFLLGLLILILAGIFKYGNYLQSEYDSTL